MKFYKYKQLQRCTFFGLDDLNLYEDFSCIKTSPQTQQVLLTILKY